MYFSVFVLLSCWQIKMNITEHFSNATDSRMLWKWPIMHIVCFFCFHFWLLCIFLIFVFLFSMLPFLVNKNAYINLAKHWYFAHRLPKHLLRKCWMCRMMHHGPRNKTTERLARRLEVFKLQCSAIAASSLVLYANKAGTLWLNETTETRTSVQSSEWTSLWVLNNKKQPDNKNDRRWYTMLSYRRETALQGILVLAESGILKLPTLTLTLT